MDKDGALYAPFPHCKEEKLFSSPKCDIRITSKYRIHRKIIDSLAVILFNDSSNFNEL